MRNVKACCLVLITGACGLGIAPLAGTRAQDPAKHYQVFWVQRTDVGSPGPRYGHALAYDSTRGVTIFFGGEYSEVGGDPEYFNDTWEYDGVSWRKIAIEGPVPAPRARHAMCYDNVLHQVILFGGFGDGKFFGDVWDYESTGPQKGRWIPRPDAVNPIARYGHTMVFDYFKGVAVMAGGTPDSNFLQLGDVWTLNNGSGLWLRQQPDHVGFAGNHDAGSGLTAHMMLYDSSRHFSMVLGGIGPYGIGLVANSKFWYVVPSASFVEAGDAVSEGAAVYDSQLDMYFQFGGNNYERGYDPKLAFPSRDEVWFPFTGGFPISFYPSEVPITFVFNETPSVQPGDRAQCAMVYDEKRHASVLVGGVGGTRYGDTWEYTSHDQSETWADFNYSGRAIGTFALPLRSLAGVEHHVFAGGTLKIKTSSSPETPKITNAMRIQAIGGPVTIGRR